MNQTQKLTEYWGILDDFEDFMNDRFRRERLDTPVFKEKTPLPLDPSDCCSCSLSDQHSELRSPLFAVGESRPVFLVNRALSAELAKDGNPFTPQAGEFASKWFSAIGMDMDLHCAIAPVVRCPSSTLVSGQQLNTCIPFLNKEIDRSGAKVLIVLGTEKKDFFASHCDERGCYRGIPLFVFPHPDEVLINLDLKRPVWELLKRVKEILG